MGILLDTIDITGLIKNDLFSTGIKAVAEDTCDGGVIVYEKPIKYFSFELVGGSDWGWLPLEILNQLQQLAKVSGSIYTLNYEGFISNVRFRTEDSPVIYGDKLINRSNQDISDYYNNISIKLMEI